MDFKKLDLKVRNLRSKDARYDVALGNSVVVRVAATGGKSFVLKALIGDKQQRLARAFLAGLTPGTGQPDPEWVHPAPPQGGPSPPEG